MIAHDIRTRGMSHHPICELRVSTTAMSAVAPAGGCIVPEIAISVVAMAHESAPPTQRMWSSSSARPKSLDMQTPMTEAMICERTALRGCDRGACMAWNSRTAAAPWEELEVVL